MPSPHDNRRGIFAVVISMLFFTVNDTMVKLVARSSPYGETIFIRGVFTILCIMVALATLGQLPTITKRWRGMVIGRGIFDALGALLFIAALVKMPLAALFAILSTSPLLLTIFSVVLFGEVVGWRRWSAIAFGLIGMLFIIKPSPASFDSWALLGLAAATASALRDLCTLRIHSAIPPLTVAFASAVIVTLSGLVYGLTETWQMLTPLQFLYLAIAAICLSIGTYLLVTALRHAEVSVVAPFRYILLVWAGMAGFLVFGEVPDRWTILGAAFIAASGLYTLHRETVRRRHITGDTPIR